VFPIDPQSGGTWIGANDQGLVAVLLNRNPRTRRTAARNPSRGGIVPRLLRCGSMDSALREAASVEAEPFEPFRIVLVQSGEVATFSNVASGARDVLDVPLMFTSSSLGDEVVEAPRRLLFERLVLRASDRAAGQFRFHRHQWARQLDVSVQMHRADAATVSRTTIDVTGLQVRFDYEPLCR
jgi:hypothetical protein